ncbi:hypothetical protein B0H16DRAFT_1480613 [Mycena metata]|uniref:Uncharacterized protein n=1 Tax=Mycena metata TaxID=1033252 RepID=A0AAD7H3M3_9AGAR|nr:hypothetical protein B0H16DRAFT_1480613 [Mycena metata]
MPLVSSRLVIAIAPIRLGLIPIVPISPILLGSTPFLSISLSGLHWMTTHNYRLYSCVADIGYPVLSPPPSDLLGLGSGHSPSRSQRLVTLDPAPQDRGHGYCSVAVLHCFEPVALSPLPAASIPSTGAQSIRASTTLNPNGGDSTSASTPGAPRLRTSNATASSSAGSSVLSALGSISLSSQTPTRSARSQTRVASSPSGGYETDHFYDEDSDGDRQRYWAARGLEELYTNVDNVFDALHQNMHRLCYMEVCTSTNEGTLRRFVAM